MPDRLLYSVLSNFLLLFYIVEFSIVSFFSCFAVKLCFACDLVMDGLVHKYFFIFSVNFLNIIFSSTFYIYVFFGFYLFYYIIIIIVSLALINLSL